MECSISMAINKIATQQTGLEGTAPFMVGEQLKDICKSDARVAELILQDLDIPEMSITEAEKKIKAYADKHKTGNFSCVTPLVADGFLREFYGLHKPTAGAAELGVAVSDTTTQGKIIDLADFLG